MPRHSEIAPKTTDFGAVQGSHHKVTTRRANIHRNYPPKPQRAETRCRPLSVRSSCEQHHRLHASVDAGASTEAQEAELSDYGAVRVFTDRGESSRVADRPQWLACLDYLRPGDTLVIRKLDRIAGSEVRAIQTRRA